jgi:hypothetical protein
MQAVLKKRKCIFPSLFAARLRGKVMSTPVCYIEQFPHRLPHDREAVLLPCGHYACPPHTITYYGTGDDEELVGDYCLVCYAKKFPQHCPDRLLLTAVLQEAEH